MRAVYLTAVLLCASAAAARAQDADASDGKSISVTANFQAQATVADAATVEDMTKAVTRMQAALGEVVGKQCDLFATALKGSCMVVQLNMNSNIEGRRRNPNFAGAPKRVFANISATFDITPAAEPKP